MASDGLNKSAILLMSLGEDEAAEVFKHLGPREVQKIGAAPPPSDEEHYQLEMTFWRPSFIQLFACFLLSAGAAFWIERVQRMQFSVRQALDEERAHSERLLSISMPPHALARLKRGETQIADAFLEAVVLFVDLAGFTDISKRIGPRQTVRVLDRIFTAFDDIVARGGLERVERGELHHLALDRAPPGADGRAQRGHAQAVRERPHDLHRLGAAAPHGERDRLGVDAVVAEELEALDGPLHRARIRGRDPVFRQLGLRLPARGARRGRGA